MNLRATAAHAMHLGDIGWAMSHAAPYIEGWAAGTAMTVAAVVVGAAIRRVHGKSERGGTLTMMRGHYRAFIDATINHRERWVWRVVDVKYGHKQVGNGESHEEMSAVSNALGLLKQLTE